MKLLDLLASYKKSDKLAMCCEQEYLTYRQLWEQSDLLASYINVRCENSKKPIVVYGHKHPRMLVSFLACVKSGRPYVPIDISVPLDRAHAIISSVNPDLVIATEAFDFVNDKVIFSFTEDISFSPSLMPVTADNYISEEDVFYIIFTSGSTGTPKGVQITYRALNRFVSWALTLGHIKKQHKCYINQAPFSFDLSVMDLYMNLASESCLYGLTKEVQSDYRKLFSALSESKADVWVSTPSFADLCIADSSFTQDLLPNLRLFLFCGEILTNATARHLIERFPKAQIYNTYGPTESTVAVTEIPVTEDICKRYNPLPVGTPKPGTLIKIMEDNTELPEGETGEIIIIGDTVSAGYWKNKIENQKKFFTYTGPEGDFPAYRTGDKGYINNGFLFYCGRIDLQIKLHGYRMEIEDIEKNLMKVKGLEKAVVVPIYKDQKVSHLKAFCIYHTDSTSTIEMKKAIKSELAAFVPSYMVPKIITFVTELPMTNNGKIDRKAVQTL